MRNSSRPVLLVEDDSIDAMTVKRAFKDLNVANPLVHTLNGEEALKYLKNQENKIPCIILLDLNMPRMNGIEFMQVVKADDKLKEIPIVVLTTSQEERDKIKSFGLGVAGYMLKSVDYKEFVETIRTINIYWTLSELPAGE
ncbi:MAG: response regulator [Phycisphaerae bacterium]|nr:response regulator [Phycisphaerae bacterium]MDD5380943.1 response regulator [Phycisphaerae bacterium]